MTKRILYIVNAVLLVLVIVFDSVVFSKVNGILDSLRGPMATDPTDTVGVPSTGPESSSIPSVPESQTPSSVPTVPESTPPAQTTPPTQATLPVPVHLLHLCPNCYFLQTRSSYL